MQIVGTGVTPQDAITRDDATVMVDAVVVDAVLPDSAHTPVQV
jgi:hypothetical protein